MFNRNGIKYSPELYKSFGLYDIVFTNRQYRYFSLDTIENFKKVLLSRGYAVEYYTDEQNVSAFTSEKTPFLVKYENYYFLAENTFSIENLSNKLIFEFNVYLLNMIMSDDESYSQSENFKSLRTTSLSYSKIEFLMPLEYILSNPKTRRYFYYSRKSRELLEALNKAIEYKSKYQKKLKIRLSVDLAKYNKRFVLTYEDNYFLVFLKLNKQGGIEDYYSTRFNPTRSFREILESKVIDLNLDDYIVSVVTSEMPDYFNIEALKAQAVCARTYAMKNLNRHKYFDLCDRPHCQNYEGEKVETFKSFIAAFSTYGEVITYKGTLINAVYHSTCGGITANSEDVWGAYVPYLRSVKDFDDNIDNAYCKESRLFKWTVKINLKRAEKILSKTVPHLLNQKFEGNIKKIVLQKNSSGRIQKLTLFTTKASYSISKDDSIYLFSDDLYYSLLPSNFVDKVEIVKGEIVFYGRGFGHGVGMCQFGANHLAKTKNYKEIIKHYYKDTEVVSIEN
jgi:stage II sporulation protein D